MARFYLTTPIYYANDAPHVGNAYTTVNADALARWHRLIGDETKFLTGTDEHGQKVADAAAKNGLSPQEWTDAKSQQFRDAWAALDIHYDDFIRTTEPRHYQSVQKFLTAIYDNGYIYKDVYKGLYSSAARTTTRSRPVSTASARSTAVTSSRWKRRTGSFD